jgi:hypothetical protein
LANGARRIVVRIVRRGTSDLDVCGRAASLPVGEGRERYGELRNDCEASSDRKEPPRERP